MQVPGVSLFVQRRQECATENRRRVFTRPGGYTVIGTLLTLGLSNTWTLPAALIQRENYRHPTSGRRLGQL